jgi:hypothetical protein
VKEKSNSYLSDNLKSLFNILGCTNSDIAVYADCSASNISRMRSGSRTYNKNSKTVINLNEGIYEYCNASNCLDKLCLIISCDRKDAKEDIKASTINWLYSENSNINQLTENLMNQKKIHFRFFGEKLNAMMDMLKLSNVRMGKAINVDPSYISKLRNGVRMLKRNSELSEDIAKYLLERIIEQDKYKQLSRIMNISMAVLQNEAYIKTAFLHWLTDLDNDSSASAIEKLLESIDGFTPAIPKELPDIASIITPLVMKDKDSEYIGIEGLRKAVIKFLSNVIMSRSGEIWLYSDQDMAWINDDKRFLSIWTVLLGACVRNRVKIKIIHTIDRDADEMIKGIENWLPLYMSGMVEPYFSKKRSDLRFSHSLFICPNAACVESFNVKGSEDAGLYRYHNDQAHIKIFEAQFDFLLASCEPLMRIYTQSDLAKYIFYMDNVFNKSGIVTMLNSLSIGLLPKKTLESMLKRVNITDEEEERIFAFHLNRVNMYNNAINYANVYDIIPLPKPDDVAQGKISLSLDNISSGLRIPYTKEDYEQHVANVLDLIRTKPSYNLVNLPEVPFLNVQIILNGDIVTVAKSNVPQIAFVISNSLMAQAFKDYIKKLMNKYNQSRKDIEQKLSEYLA